MLRQIEGWQLWTSDAKFNLVKEVLTGFIRSFEGALFSENEQYRSGMRAAETAHKEKSEELRRRYLTGPIREAEEERDRRVKDLIEGWRGKSGILTKTNNSLAHLRQICTYRTGANFIERGRISSARKRNAATEAAFQQGEESLRQKAGAIDSKIEQMRRLSEQICAYKCEIARKEYEEAQRKENAEYDDALRVLQQKHTQQMEQLISRYQKAFAERFNPETLNTAQQYAESLMASPEPDKFKRRDTVPEAMYFGDRTFIIRAQGAMFDAGVIGMIRALNHPALRMNPDNSAIVVKLPYCRTLQEGYSVFALCEEPQHSQCDELIRSYIMKVLMNFPARVRPLLVDSDSTTVFSLYSGVGEAIGKGFSTRPRNNAKDIEAELEKIASERHQLVASYGDDAEARLAREPVYFVACRNFPKGITNEALHDLDVIWLAGSAYGFFGIVTASPREFQRVENPDQIARMKQNSLVLMEKGAGWLIGDDEGDFLSFDHMPRVMAASGEMLQRIIHAYVTAPVPIIEFDDLFALDAGNVEGIDVNNRNTWQSGDASKGCEIPIGVFGARTVQKLTIEGTKHHVLITGITGSGKSALLNTIIMASMIKYTPEQVNFYLIDFKEGVEFAPMAQYNLPWIKMIAVNTEREFARSILRELESEFKRRAEAMKQESVSKIGNTSRDSHPRIFLVIDELQLLLSEDDAITKECARILATLAEEGRAMNINLIMASQNFSLCIGMDRIKKNMAIRIGLAGKPEDAGYIMEDDDSAKTYQLESGAGFAAIKFADNSNSPVNYFQVGFLTAEERNRLLRELMEMNLAPDHVTRILSRSASMDVNNRFNRLILRRQFEYAEDPSEYELMIGEFSVRRKYIRFAPRPGDNLLIMGDKEENAKSITALAVMSFLYDELTCRAGRLDNELVRILDLTPSESLYADYFDGLQKAFSSQVNLEKMAAMDRLIGDTYDHMQRRKNGEADATERLLLVVFGFEGAGRKWQKTGGYGTYGEGMTLAQKLAELLTDGPALGVNTIIWAQSLPALTLYLPLTLIDDAILMRIFYGPNLKETCETLTGVTPDETVLEGRMAQYKHLDEVSSIVMRLYDIPEPEWYQRYSEVYMSIVNGRKGN